MITPFKILPIKIDRFASLMRMSDEELLAIGARRMVADKKPGFPCRVSLVDAEPGEEVLLLPFTHHDVSTPYRGSGPIFIRSSAKTARLEVNEIPALLRSRLLSIRAYDSDAMMRAAEVVEGTKLEEHILRMFEDKDVEYLHIHNAKPGCFNCEVRRA